MKLAAKPADLADLAKALAALAPGSTAITRTLTTTYYDTPDRALRRTGSIFRVREQEGQFIQTIKTADPGNANPLARGEWEDTVAGSRPDPHAPQTGLYLPQGTTAELRPLFVTEVARTAIDIEPKPGTRIEAAVDQGAVRTTDGGRSEAISEIELELKSGDPAALYEIALQLFETAPVRIDLSSKSDRGYRLVEGDKAPPPAVSADPVILHPAMTIEEALQQVGRACLAHLLRNEPAALAAQIEGVHQMRVATRRLRSMLSAVKKMLPEEERGWVSNEIRELAGALGPARNLDVFATELLPPARQGAPEQPGWDELSAAADAARADAYRHVGDEIRSPRHTAALLRLLCWFEGRGWRREQTTAPDDALAVSIGTVAPAVLDQRRRVVRKRSRHFRGLPAQGRHRLRIAVKKLRYAIELLDSLYDRRDAQPFVKRLKRVQDELGHANDVRVSYGLVIELGRAAARAEPMADAAAQLLARHERALAEGEERLRQRLRRLNRTPPFWRN